jgi:DNA-binding MarR family transcriptional regulator
LYPLPRVPPGSTIGGVTFSRDDSTSAAVRTALDRVLELVERRHLSATELRVLFALIDGEASLFELAEALVRRPIEIRRAGRSLAGRGLVRWRHVGVRKATRLTITPAGLATVEALCDCFEWETGPVHLGIEPHGRLRSGRARWSP